MVKKANLNEKEIENQRREIEVLRICDHPYVIKLLDVFESIEYIFIILELMEGGDLFDYLQSRDHKTSEQHAKQIYTKIV